VTIKPPRTFVEVPIKEKIKYIKRKQEEVEANRALEDFLRHQQEEEDAAPNPVQRTSREY
jgi:hypothetical protein